MGNIAAFDQLPSPLRSLNEDNMVVLLQYLDVADYVHLTVTCRKFLHETLGPLQNNYFWAQLLNRPWQPVQIYSSIPYITSLPPLLPTQPTVVNTPTPTQRLVNHVLQTTRNGRKFEVDGTPLDLTIPLDTLNKKLVGHFDFRNEIKMYFFKAKWAPALATQFTGHVIGTNARADVRVEESIKPQDYFSKPMQVLPNELVSDVTFVVDLGVDPTSLESIKPIQLRSTFKRRRVVYVKSNVHAMDYSMMSRSRMPPPPIHPMMQPQLIPQYASNPVPLPYYGGPGGPGVPLNAPSIPYYQPNLPPQPVPPQFNQPHPFYPPQPYGALPNQPQPQPQIGFRPVQPHPQIGFRPVQPHPQIGFRPAQPPPQIGFRPAQPPPIIGTNGPSPVPPQQQQQQQQYRNAAFDQLPSPLRSLNEDNMVVLLQYLDVADYVHLTMTCRKFLHETLGPNNYFWAQLLNHPWQHLYAGYSLPPPPPQKPTPMVITPPLLSPIREVNQVLHTTRNGRKFEVDGKPLDLTIPLDTLNKNLVGHFDFRQEIKMYFFMAKCTTALAAQLANHVIGTNARAEVIIRETITPIDFFIKPMQLQPNELITDVTFVVDLGVDATSLEKLKQMQLPSVFKSRRVVYKKHTVYAIYNRMFPRSRMQMPIPIPQAMGGPVQPPMPHYQLAPKSYASVPPQPLPQPQIGFRPVQPPIIGANAPSPLPPPQQEQQYQKEKGCILM